MKSEIFLSPESGNGSLSKVYEKAFNEAVEIYILSAYLTHWAKDYELSKKCNSITFIVGSDFGLTKKKACRDVISWLPKSMKHRLFVANNSKNFHPKTLIWKNSKNKFYSLIGSSNLTDAAFSKNYEVNVCNEINKNQYNSVIKWIREIESEATPLTEEWLGNYTEATSRPKQAELKYFDFDNLEPLEIKRLLKDRMKKKKYFDQNKLVLLKAVKDCRNSKLKNIDFYDLLNEIWCYNTFRVQAGGWHIKGKNSNFKQLCDSIISIYKAAPENRDNQVVLEIDRLDFLKIPTRGSLLSELLCHFFPKLYPIVNKPINDYLQREGIKLPSGISDGSRYIYKANILREVLNRNQNKKVNDLLDLDVLIQSSITQ